MKEDHPQPPGRDGRPEDAVRPDSMAEGFAPMSPVSFELAGKNLVFTLVGTVQSTRRSASILAAFEATALTDLVILAQRQADIRARDGKDAEVPMREAISEVSAALRVSDRVAQRLLSDAVTLTTAFCQTHAALADGLISPAHVRVIMEAGCAITDHDSRATYEAQVLGVAEKESAGRLRSLAQILAARANPESIDVRHRRARTRRHVRVVEGDDGMAELTAYLPAALAHGIHDRLTQMAHAFCQRDAGTADPTPIGDGMLPGMAEGIPAATEQDVASAQSAPGDDALHIAAATSVAARAEDVATDPPRTIDELRADLFADLLLTGAPTGHGDGLENIRGHVQVTVPVLTLAGASAEPATLTGHGPVDVTTARRLTGAAAGWDRVLTHPLTGEVLAVDRYRPSEQLRRFLRVRDGHCRFPGCRVPAWRTDVDHTVDAALGGRTEPTNLASLCESHHMLKHLSRWRVLQSDGGRLQWTSPTGRIYIDTPHTAVTFVTDGDPPPF